MEEQPSGFRYFDTITFPVSSCARLKSVYTNPKNEQLGALYFAMNTQLVI